MARTTLQISRNISFSRYVPRPDVADIQSVISAVSLLREPAKPGETVRMVPLRTARNALIELLDQNDNTDNKVRFPFSEGGKMADLQYSDCSYTATLISALGNMMGTATDNRAATAIEKAITLDRLLPSFGNVVTKAGLEVCPRLPKRS